jgi:hypothetical protein
VSDAESRAVRLRRGRDRLREIGLDPERASLEELERGLAAGADAALCVAEVLGSRPADESAALLRKIESGAGSDKELRREARRSLYRLAQKGIAGAEREKQPAAPPVVSAPAAPQPEGALSFPDPAGSRLVWLVKSRVAGGVLHVAAVVNEPGGLEGLAAAERSRRELRALRSRLETVDAVRLVDVDARYVDWVVSEAYERSRARGPLPEGAAEWPQVRLLLFRSPPEPAALPLPQPLIEGYDPGYLATSAEALEEPELRNWVLPEATLRPWLTRVEEVRSSPLFLDRSVQVDRVEEVVRQALREMFPAETRPSWRRRLEEMAYFLWQTSRPDAARRVLAAARALAASEFGAQGIPFLEALVRRSLAFHFALEEARAREERASSLIVTPGEIRAARRSPSTIPPPTKR